MPLEYIVGVVERVIFSSARDFVLERHRVFLEEFLCRVVVYLFTVLVNRFPLLIFTTFSSVTFVLKSLIVLDFKSLSQLFSFILYELKHRPVMLFETNPVKFSLPPFNPQPFFTDRGQVFSLSNEYR